MVTSNPRAGSRTVRAVATAVMGPLLALALLGATAAPAAAAGDELLVSTDGVDFVADSTLPLFTGMGRVVPGDQSTEQVWVRNDSGVAAVLRVDLVDPSADDAALADAVSLSVAPQGGTASSPVTIGTGVGNGGCTVLGGGMALAAGESLRLDLTAGVDPALAGRHGMRGTVRFRLRAVLVETAAAGEVTPGRACRESPEHSVAPSTPGSGRLPNTGSGSLLPLGPFAGVALLVGVVCCVIAWRRRDGDDEAVAGGWRP